jgi:hypothetical protein
MNSRRNLHKAFKILEQNGYIAPRKAYWCCSSCGLADLPEGTEKYVFYHEQDFDRWKENGRMMLAWGGNGNEIKTILEQSGLNVNWDGTDQRRIEVF